MKTTADATISVDQLTAKFKTWQLYTHSNTYASARIVYDLSHRVDGPLDICSAQLKSFVEFRPKLRSLFSGYWFFIVDSKIVLSFVNPSVLSTYIASYV